MKRGGKTRDEAFRIALIELGMLYEDTWAGKMDVLARKKALLGEMAKGENSEQILRTQQEEIFKS
jgi:hypothetical protein